MNPWELLQRAVIEIARLRRVPEAVVWLEFGGAKTEHWAEDSPRGA